MPAHLDSARGSGRLPVGPVTDLGPHRLGSVALTPPVVELVGELLRNRVVAGLAGVRHVVGPRCARFVLSAKYFLCAHVAPLSIKMGSCSFRSFRTSRNHTHQTVQKISLDKISHALWRIRESQA